MKRPLCTAAATLLATVSCTISPTPVGDDFEVSEGLELTVWASEPLLVNPTNFDIDERGRVWLIESVNYRSDLKSQPWNDLEGDRIVILEDTDGDGTADSRKVFDQHAEMLAPLGITVLGNRVIVSQSPDLVAYTKDEDDRIVSRETLLTGWGGRDHDHGLHVVVFGHDGRYYFNSGDQGFETTDRSGNTVRSSRDGPFYAATVQSVNPDGTGLRVLAHNARNPFELALDSFGSIWQTDNDDDGNQWTRLLYVMEGANFGYWGPGGRRWREDRGTHFHEERPGTTPYVARTGPGSPAGLAVYEGSLLPSRFHGQLLHAEPGKRLIQAFLVKPDGAGYSMEAENVVFSTDPLFRPSDVAVAPDGSVFIADWQDPVVGGHNMLDIERGRILRLAPVGHRGTVPPLDLQSESGLLAALASPNQATRYRADAELRLLGEAERRRLLLRAWQDPRPSTRARALWQLAGLGEAGAEALEEARASDDPRFRVLALRVARLHRMQLEESIAALAEDPDPAVRREAALMLRDLPAAARRSLWPRLAAGYDGSDRWLLAALGIAAEGERDRLFAALQETGPAWTSRLADLYRILQAPASVPMLTGLVTRSDLPLDQRLQALEALGWQPLRTAARTVAAIAGDGREAPELRNRALYFLRKQLFSEWSGERESTAVQAAVARCIRAPATRGAALELALMLASPALVPALEGLVREEAASLEDRVAALRALGPLGGDSVERLLRDSLAGEGTAMRIAAIEGLWARSPDGSGPLLEGVLLSEAPNEVRTAALRALGRRPPGLHRILDLEQSQELPAELRAAATTLVNGARNAEVRARASDILPAPASRSERPVVRAREIVEAVGSADRGRAVYERTDGSACAKCHSLEAGEEIVGPSLAAIGTKYGREGMLNAILHPSEGIAPEYASWILDTVSHGLLTGLLVEDTPERIVLRTEAADEIHLQPSDILDRRKGSLSIMPEDLVTTMTHQELIDLIAFLETLRSGV